MDCLIVWFNLPRFLYMYFFLIRRLMNSLLLFHFVMALDARITAAVL
jgi:hypothetical protein